MGWGRGRGGRSAVYAFAAVWEFVEERGVSFVVACEGYEWGECAYEEGGKGSGFVFFAFVVDVLRRLPNYVSTHHLSTSTSISTSWRPFYESDLAPPFPSKRKRGKGCG